MSMSMGLRMCHVPVCSVCDQAIADPSQNLKDKLDGRGNDPMTVFLFLIQAGCCPNCGTEVSSGQTPDEIIARFNKLLKKRLEERLEET